MTPTQDKSIQKKRIVVIGGGTGTFVALKGLKEKPYELSAVISMSDSGGSNKRIRDEFGLLPTSDLRQCLVALSNENGGAGLMRKLFMYRFDKGNGISGMTFGNLFMAALTDILGSQKEAIKKTGDVLRIKGSVIPVTFTDTNLVAEYEDGTTLYEEHDIDEPNHPGSLKITNLRLEPEALANPDAVDAIMRADMVILGPGDLYTSVLPNVIVSGIKDALIQTSASIVYVMNLMTKYGQTYDYTAQDHLKAIEQYIPGKLSHVIVNTGMLPKEAIDLYATEGEHPVVDDLADTGTVKVIRADLMSRYLVEKTASDTLVRSLIRHDSKKLADVIASIIQS
jgi:uncharacterized cofD-like protein